MGVVAFETMVTHTAWQMAAMKSDQGWPWRGGACGVCSVATVRSPVEHAPASILVPVSRQPNRPQNVCIDGYRREARHCNHESRNDRTRFIRVLLASLAAPLGLIGKLLSNPRIYDQVCGCFFSMKDIVGSVGQSGSKISQHQWVEADDSSWHQQHPTTKRTTHGKEKKAKSSISRLPRPPGLARSS